MKTKLPISNDPRTGTVHLQPVMLEGVVYLSLREALDADFFDHKPPNWQEGEIRRLECLWSRWWRAKTVIDADWKKDAQARLDAVAEEIADDKVKLAVDKILEEQAAREAADQKVIDAYLEKLAAVFKACHSV